MGAVRYGADGAKLDVARDGVEERVALDKEKINAEDDVAVVVEHRRGQRNRFEHRSVRGGAGTRGLPFERGDVGTINDKSALRIQWRDWTVANKTSGKDALESSFTGSPDHAVQGACRVSIRDIASAKKLFLVGDCGHHVVSCNAVATSIRKGNIDIQTTYMFEEFHRRSIEAVNDHGRFRGGVHRDATNFANFRERENVCDGLRVKPNLAEVREIAHEGRVLVAAVCNGAKNMFAWPDVR